MVDLSAAGEPAPRGFTSAYSIWLYDRTVNVTFWLVLPGFVRGPAIGAGQPGRRRGEAGCAGRLLQPD